MSLCSRCGVCVEVVDSYKAMLAAMKLQLAQGQEVQELDLERDL